MVEKKAEQLVIQEFVKEHNLLLHISGTKSTKVKPVLPEYCLDFGYVVYGLVASHTITLTNIGSFPLTFSPAHSSLAESGFTIKLGNKIKALPENESIEFTVLFDPASVNHLLGYAEITLPFQVWYTCIIKPLYSGQLDKLKTLHNYRDILNIIM